jgi:hypothetical protein
MRSLPEDVGLWWHLEQPGDVEMLGTKSRWDTGPAVKDQEKLFQELRAAPRTLHWLSVDRQGA